MRVCRSHLYDELVRPQYFFGHATRLDFAFNIKTPLTVGLLDLLVRPHDFVDKRVLLLLLPKYFRGNKTHLSAKSKPIYGKLKHLSVGPHDFVGRTTIYFLLFIYYKYLKNTFVCWLQNQSHYREALILQKCFIILSSYTFKKI